jgi:hypothetical protein
VEGVPLRVNQGALLATPLGSHARIRREEGVPLRVNKGALLATPLGSHARDGRWDGVPLGVKYGHCDGGYCRGGPARVAYKGW